MENMHTPWPWNTEIKPSLIASAPELFAALRAVVEHYGYDRPEGVPDCIIAARAAIAKAGS